MGDYGSEFEYDSEAGRKRSRRYDLAGGEKRTKTAVASKRELADEYDKYVNLFITTLLKKSILKF